MTIEPGVNQSFSLNGESRLKKQDNSYNVAQHEKTVEMLSRLNGEKMKRQERAVMEMKRKQEAEIRKL